jgi:hypothetical protein
LKTKRNIDMKVNWDLVPEWINWVTVDVHPSNDSRMQPNAHGWCSKPELHKDNRNINTYWDNFYCSEDDGFVCELPHYVACWEEGDTLENSIEERPVPYV